MEKVFCPEPNGWAERVQCARKDHVCHYCRADILRGSSYISVHSQIAFQPQAWMSSCMCEDCYRKCVESTSRGPIRKLPDGIVLRYETPDGEIFNSLRAASDHTKQLRDSYMMFNNDGKRTDDVASATVLHIKNVTGMKYFIAACIDYMKDKPAGHLDVSGGLIDDYRSDPELFAESQFLLIFGMTLSISFWMMNRSRH